MSRKSVVCPCGGGVVVNGRCTSCERSSEDPGLSSEEYERCIERYAAGPSGKDDEEDSTRRALQGVVLGCLLILLCEMLGRC